MMSNKTLTNVVDIWKCWSGPPGNMSVILQIILGDDKILVGGRFATFVW